MCIVPRICSGGHIREGEQVQLRLTRSTRRIDGEKNWPSDEAADQTDDGGDLEEAKEKVAIHGLMVQHKRIRDLPEGADPIEEPAGNGRRAFSVTISSVPSPIPENLGADCTYCSRSVERYVLGAYCRFCRVRRQRKASVKIPARMPTGTRVEISPDKDGVDAVGEDEDILEVRPSLSALTTTRDPLVGIRRDVLYRFDRGNAKGLQLQHSVDGGGERLFDGGGALDVGRKNANGCRGAEESVYGPKCAVGV